MALFSKKKSAQGGSASGEKEEIKNEPQEMAEVKDKIKPTAKLPKGGDEMSYAAIISPHVTEKASNMGALNKYSFKVNADSNKFEIKNAIEKMYKVKVKKVAIVTMPSKARRVGRHEGVKPGFKKAIVTLVEGDKIEITG